jgi:two-component system, NtrC family, sensor histidine kinase HydH
MEAQKMTTGMSYLAFGGVAAYLGFLGKASGFQFHPVPMAIALSIALVGWMLLTRQKKKSPALSEPCLPRDRELLGHEMKNYLCTLKGNARLLRQRLQTADGDIIDRIDSIDKVVEKLESFLRNMDAPDAVASGVLWQLRIYDAAKACVKSHFHKEAARFRWDIDEESPRLLGDPDRLEQVFLNLYANSLEAGALQVITSVHRAGDALQIRIEDDGRGCAPEDLTRIFEPFFTTKSGPARRGLGMFIVQSIVENHGGRICVSSKNGLPPGGHGLIFSLEFPIYQPGPTEARLALKGVGCAEENIGRALTPDLA